MASRCEEISELTKGSKRDSHTVCFDFFLGFVDLEQTGEEDTVRRFGRYHNGSEHEHCEPRTSARILSKLVCGS